MPPEASAKARQPSAISLIAKNQTAIGLIAKNWTAISQTAKSPGCRNIPGFRSYLKSDVQQSASVNVS